VNHYRSVTSDLCSAVECDLEVMEMVDCHDVLASTGPSHGVEIEIGT
jgi:hypothetical protein